MAAYTGAMPRDGGPARLRLQQAALELYEQHGFDQVTTAEIAARAGVTERTFYRHFADKREVLFNGERALLDAILAGIADAPRELAPLPTLLWAFRTLVPLLEGNRRVSVPLQRVIAASPALRERAHMKWAILTDTLATALHDRGVPEPTASLAARIGVTALNHISAIWIHHPDQSLDKLLSDTFAELYALTAPLADD